MPNVSLINWTGAGHPDPLFAARVLAFTKSTRLNMSPGLFSKFINDTPESEIHETIEAMSRTIPSSWEFVDLTFMIEDVSRATAQQITRSRNASFAMQSQRVTDMSSASFTVPESLDVFERPWFESKMNEAIWNYSEAIDMGLSKEDARDFLPMGIHCNLVAKYNLRALVELINARSSSRVQGPYRSVIDQMKAETLSVWPWSAPFFQLPNEKAIAILQEVVEEHKTSGAVYQGIAGQVAKAIDLIKKG